MKKSIKIIILIIINIKKGTISAGSNEEFETDTIRFSFSSPIIPERIYDYNLKLRKLILLREELINNLPKCEVKQINIQSNGQDEKNIINNLPITIIRTKYSIKSEYKEKSLSPLLIISYGAYGHSVLADYRSFIIPLLQRFIFIFYFSFNNFYLFFVFYLKYLLNNIII